MIKLPVDDSEKGWILIEPIPTQEMPEGTGICPFPGQKQMDTYIKSYKQMIGKAVDVMHTDDRYNLRSQFFKMVNPYIGG